MSSRYNEKLWMTTAGIGVPYVPNSQARGPGSPVGRNMPRSRSSMTPARSNEATRRTPGRSGPTSSATFRGSGVDGGEGAQVTPAGQHRTGKSTANKEGTSGVPPRSNTVLNKDFKGWTLSVVQPVIGRISTPKEAQP
jgi:hypothetical protein